jgi:hypothetical protein
MVEKHWTNNRLTTLANAGEGALIIVGKRDQDKFFSNGFLYDSIKNNPGFFTGLYRRPRYLLTIQILSYPDIANPLYARLLTFPSVFSTSPAHIGVHPSQSLPSRR